MTNSTMTMTSTDFENQSESEGESIRKSRSFQTCRPERRKRASLEPVPYHLRKHYPQAIPKVIIPKWLEQHFNEPKEG